jgi:hypothetical protein
MKKIMVILIAIFCTSAPVRLYAQIYYSVNYHTKGPKIYLESGNLSFLKGQTKINVEYIYEGMMVGNKTEADYVQEKIEKYNKNEAGKGDKWLENWKNDRIEKFQPKFEELINKYLVKATVNLCPKNTAAKYTLILKTDFTEPGFNVGVMRQPAFISATVIFVETSDKSNEIAKISIENSPGQDVAGSDFETGYRLQEAYAKCGKELAKFLMKKAFK